MLNKEKLRKTVGDRGTSESTSGCDSGQNYESDEMDNVSAKSASQPPSSEEDSGHVRSSPYVMQGCIAPMTSPSAEGIFTMLCINAYLFRNGFVQPMPVALNGVSLES